jgi:hypothetical protein
MYVMNVCLYEYTIIYVFQKELYSGIPNVTVASVTKTFKHKGVQTRHRSRSGSGFPSNATLV